MKLVAALLAIVAVVGCGEVTPARTQVMVVVDSDLDVPSELDELAFRVRGPDGESKRAMAALGSGDDALPRSLALVHEGGPLEPLEVVVEGRLDGKIVLDRAARLAWVSGKTLVLPMYLLRTCVDVECGAGTCTENGCESVDVDPEALPTWSGDEPRLGAADGSGADDDGTDGPDELDAGGGGGGGATGPDGGGTGPAGDGTPVPDGGMAAVDGGGSMSTPDASTTPDAGMCVPATELCNELDDDCDGVADNGFDLLTDEANCGICNRACTGAKNICCNGACQKNCN